jgi:hypothetical protein
LTRPTIVAVEGEAANCLIGQKVMGIDADNPDFVGIALNVRPVEQRVAQFAWRSAARCPKSWHNGTITLNALLSAHAESLKFARARHSECS